MKLKTIWTIPAMSISERAARTIDLAAMTTAAHLPARVRYWTFIQVGTKAMPDDAIIPSVLFMDLLQNAEGGRK